MCISHRFYYQVLNDVNGGEFLIRSHVAACNNYSVVVLVEAFSLSSGSSADAVVLIIQVSVHRLRARL